MSGAYYHRPQYTQNTIGPSVGGEELRSDGATTSDERGLLREKLAKTMFEDYVPQSVRVDRVLAIIEAHVAELRGELAELQGIDIACNAANEHVIKLQADLDVLNDCAKQDADVIAELKGELAEAKAKCGHPMAYWVQRIDSIQGDRDYCRLCAEKEAAVAERDETIQRLREALVQGTEVIHPQKSGEVKIKWIKQARALLDSTVSRRSDPIGGGDTGRKASQDAADPLTRIYQLLREQAESKEMIRRLLYYRAHLDGCEVDSTDFCTCGMKQITEKASIMSDESDRTEEKP